MLQVTPPLSITGNLEEAVGYVKATDTQSTDWFGGSISMNSDGTVLAVGAHGKDILDINGFASVNNLGAVYVYNFDNINQIWGSPYKLIPGDREEADHLGNSVSISADGHTVAMGAYTKSLKDINGATTTSSAGAAYVSTFNKITNQWTTPIRLQSPTDLENSDLFGYSIIVSGDGETIVVGARNKSITNGTIGKFHRFFI